MNRKDFLKAMSLASVGTPFIMNGMATRVLNQFADFSINCDAISDRVLIILRLAGANDGLNTVIPISQYDTYANLRPNIKINNSGTNGYIALDTTVSQQKLVGLHPSMAGFKALYDTGKLSLFNGVGYPNPNYSHFRSEGLMFSGKDGTNSQDLTDGIFGRYLASLFPGLAGNPTVQNPDPLAIQFGNLNPCLFYEHNTEKNIEYNATGFQSSLFSNLQIPNSEYDELLNYIKGVAASMDNYYNRVMAVFNAGNNSTTTYPNTDLGKQLKTVARMLKGGSKTKVFQVNVGGFDTHVNQVQSGSTNLGNHAVLLGNIADSVNAFQTDLENLGISERALTVTFSEFGRQVRENASNGTDHGDLAPFFVIGKNISGGIMGEHPVFTNATSYYYNQNQRKYDYRQIFASLIQDWLGADTALINSTELQTFVQPANKVNIVSPDKVASVVCSTLGTNEIRNNNNLKIYPNPANTFAILDFGKIPHSNSSIEVYDVVGRKIVEYFPSNSQQNIPLESYKNGMYILKIKAGDGKIYSEKLMVEHK